jgi:hypothetical protein
VEQSPRVDRVPRPEQGSRFQPGRVAPSPRVDQAPGVVPDRRAVGPSVTPNRQVYGDRAVPRSYNSYNYGSRNYGYQYRSGVAPRYNYGSVPYRRVEIRPFYRPYYSFRPWFSLGFGIYAGYPFAYPTWYDAYVPRAYPFYEPGMSYGGVSLDIQPADAQVFVDGEYFGVVADFSPYEAPLTLPAGRHHIDLEAPGFAPLSFDLTVVPRQVIPYQGTLSR